MSKSLNYWTRKLHRWGAVICCVPLLLIVCSGLLLQVKKQVTWVQPATVSAGHSDLTITWDDILAAAANHPDAGVTTWQDIDRLDVRPDNGIVKVQCRNRHELQIDLATAQVLASNYRRSDLIESLHDGSFFGEVTKLGIFLPSALVLLTLWFTGMWLWYLPFGVKAKKRKRLLLTTPSDKSLT